MNARCQLLNYCFVPGLVRGVRQRIDRCSERHCHRYFDPRSHAPQSRRYGRSLKHRGSDRDRHGSRRDDRERDCRSERDRTAYGHRRLDYDRGLDRPWPGVWDCLPVRLMKWWPVWPGPAWRPPEFTFYSGRVGRRSCSGLGLAILIGFVLGFVLMSLIYWLLRRVSRHANWQQTFGRLQILSSAFMAFSHGSNDGQKFMGMFALSLFLGKVIPVFKVDFWVILLCGVVMGLGTILGGWRIIKTMGFQLTRLEPVNGFAAETSAGVAITICTAFGIPLSTTHTINSAIMGVGSTQRFSAVRWGVSRRIVMTWLLTFPACGVMGYLFTLLIQWVAPKFR